MALRQYWRFHYFVCVAVTVAAAAITRRQLQVVNRIRVRIQTASLPSFHITLRIIAGMHIDARLSEQQARARGYFTRAALFFHITLRATTLSALRHAE